VWGLHVSWRVVAGASLVAITVGCQLGRHALISPYDDPWSLFRGQWSWILYSQRVEVVRRRDPDRSRGHILRQTSGRPLRIGLGKSQRRQWRRPLVATISPSL